MRQFMNEQIEDERGLMSRHDFKKMFFTSFGRANPDDIKTIYDMLLPIIESDEHDSKSQPSTGDVSIGKLSTFIDFFNYYPFVFSSIYHKNDSSEDLCVYMGKINNSNLDKETMDKLSPEEIQNVETEKRSFTKVLALISLKIDERFLNILTAFRYFDTDHLLTLTLNEFAQGVEHLRIKISFEMIKKIFNYLDSDNDGEITFKDFRKLDGDNWRKVDDKAIIECLLGGKNRELDRLNKAKDLISVKDMSLDELEGVSKAANHPVSRNITLNKISKTIDPR